MSAHVIESALREVADWNIFDANVRLGLSGRHTQLALESSALLGEMERFGIRRALVSHFAAEEYDAEEGNRLLADDLSDRFEPAWAALPEMPTLRQLTVRNLRAVRLWFGVSRHNFSGAAWCCGELCEYLQQRSVLTLISREDIEWDSLAELLKNFPQLPVLLLDIGYRADRYLFPLLQKFPNLYFETSTYLAHRQLENYVESFGSERVLFGSRLPLYTPGAALAVLATARISVEARLAIAGRNLRRLLQQGAS